MKSLTFTAHLTHAPFPYDGRFGDERGAFFDTTWRGQRAHSTNSGKVYSEKRHYSDDRVLFHVPAHFDAAQPVTIVMFFHGHNSELRRTVLDEMQIAQQIDRAQRNVILVAPQLARDAADSSAGKLFRRNGLKHLLGEAATVLAKRVNGLTATRLRAAPVILSAFSGGYRSVAFCLDRGGIDHRIAGIVLLDALYGEQDKFAAWINRRHGFAVVLGGPSTAIGHDTLVARLKNDGVMVKGVIPRKLAAGDVVLKMTRTSHGRLPQFGPPKWPLMTAINAAVAKI